MLVITLFTSFLVLLLAAAELLRTKRDRATWLLAGAYLCIGIILAHDVGRVTGWVLQHPLFFGWSLPCAYLLGPLLFWFFRDKVSTDYASPRRLRHQLAPGIVVFAALVVIHPRLFNLLSLDMASIQPGSLIGRLAVLPALVYMFVYLVAFAATIRRAFRLQNLRDMRVLRWLLALCAFALPSAILALYAYGTANLALMEYNLFYLSLVIILSFLFRSRFPDFLDDVAVAVQKGRYAVSQLKGVDLPSLRKKVQQLFDEEQIHRDDTLSLSSLAKVLGVSPHQLSEFFNAELKTSFSAYLTRHRIEEAKQLLVEKQDHTVLAIGFEVGFGSKTAFNSAFKRAEGMSPTEYREKYSPHL